MTVYESVVVDSDQVPIPGAQGYVYVDGVLTTALTDDAGLPVQNPVVTASGANAGYVKFTIPDGSYAIHWWWLGKRRLIETFTQGPQGEQGVTNITYLASGVIFDKARGDTFASKWTVPADATLTNVNGELIFNSTGTAKNLRMKLKNLAGTGDFKGAYEDDWETDFTIQLLSAFSVADVRAIECGFITDDVRISTNYFGARLGSHPAAATQVLGYLDNFSGQISTDPAGYTYAVGDTIRLRVKRSGNVISRTMNYNGGADVTTSLTANFTTGNTELPRLLQTPFFNFVRGHYKLTSAKVTIGNTNPALAIAGTSLSQGRYTTPYSQGFAQQIKAAHSSDVAVMGAPSGTSADILGSLPDLLQHYRPKTLLLEPFANDALTTVPLATTQANIAAIKALCDTSNVRLLLLNCSPLNSSFATAINNWLASSSYEVFDWYSLLVGTGIALNPLYSNGESGTPDGIHFNEAGADVVAPAIDAWLIGKGVFTATGETLIIDPDENATANSDERLAPQSVVYAQAVKSRRLRVLEMLADSIDRAGIGRATVMASPPTLAAINASSVVSGTWYRPDTYTSLYTFVGGKWAPRSSGNPEMYQPRNSLGTDGTTFTGDGASNPGSDAISTGGEKVRFSTSSPDFEIYFRGTTTANGYRLKCNGQYVKTGTFGHDGTSGTFYYQRITWGAGGASDRLLRNYELELGNGQEGGFGGVKCSVLDMPMPWAPQGGLKVAVHGDSMFVTPQESGTASSFLLPIMASALMGDLIGQSDVWPIGVGSAGFITKAGGNNNFVELAPFNLYPRDFDVIFDYGGRNDNPADVATEQAAVLSWVQGVLADRPDCLIFMSGPILSTTAQASLTQFINVATAKRNVAAMFPKNCVFLDTMAANALWVTGSGKQGATVGDGNADIVIGPDGVHPTAFGHEYFARRFAAAVRSAIPVLAAAQ